MEEVKKLRPTVEITKGSFDRVTHWGWECTCGDGTLPSARKKDHVLQEAREHFDTKHGGNHGRVER
jgi:hypothetical protein